MVTLEGYYVNGFSFATRGRDDNRVTQNSGVHIVAKAVQISSSKDKNPHTGDMHFYGKIAEIWQLDYLGVHKVLFKCDWVDARGVFIDEFGMTVVNLDRKGYKSDSFILAGHAKQVFYVKDQLDDNRWIVCPVSEKGYYSSSGGSDDIDVYAPLSNNLPGCTIDVQ